MLGLVSYEGSSDEEESDNEIETTKSNVKLINSNEIKVDTDSASNVKLKDEVKDDSKSEFHISDEEDEGVVSRTNSVNTTKKLETSSLEDNLSDISITSNSNSVFSHLPPPTSHNINKIPPVSKGSGVKITIPSLDQFDEDDEVDDNKPRKLKIQASIKGCGLFSLLPKPRNEFLATPRQVPASLSKPSNTATKSSNPLVPRQVAANKSKVPLQPGPNKPKKSGLIDYDSGDSDNEDPSNSVDFFSIPDKIDNHHGNIELDKNIEEYMKPLVEEKPKTKSDLEFKPSPNVGPNLADTSSVSSGYNEIKHEGPMYPAEEQPIELNDDVLRKLGARKRKGEDLNSLRLIEVDGSQLLPDSKEWLTKQISQETAYRPSHKKADGPTSQQKRKHQITYLAFQAKANEVDLKNQWASNRQSKRATQNKYGF